MTGSDNEPALRILQTLGFAPQGETTFEERRYAFFVKSPGAPDTL